MAVKQNQECVPTGKRAGGNWFRERRDKAMLFPTIRGVDAEVADLEIQDTIIQWFPR